VRPRRLSFNGNKIMTTLGGGMLLSDDEDLVAHARKLSTQAREPVPVVRAHRDRLQLPDLQPPPPSGAQLRGWTNDRSPPARIRDRYADAFRDRAEGVRILGTTAGTTEPTIAG
jgi:hypothetical protein